MYPATVVCPFQYWRSSFKIVYVRFFFLTTAIPCCTLLRFCLDLFTTKSENICVLFGLTFSLYVLFKWFSFFSKVTRLRVFSYLKSFQILSTESVISPFLYLILPASFKWELQMPPAPHPMEIFDRFLYSKPNYGRFLSFRVWCTFTPCNLDLTLYFKKWGNQVSLLRLTIHF